MAKHIRKISEVKGYVNQALPVPTQWDSTTMSSEVSDTLSISSILSDLLYGLDFSCRLLAEQHPGPLGQVNVNTIPCVDLFYAKFLQLPCDDCSEEVDVCHRALEDAFQDLTRHVQARTHDIAQNLLPLVRPHYVPSRVIFIIPAGKFTCNSEYAGEASLHCKVPIVARRSVTQLVKLFESSSRTWAPDEGALTLACRQQPPQPPAAAASHLQAATFIFSSTDAIEPPCSYSRFCTVCPSFVVECAHSAAGDDLEEAPPSFVASHSRAAVAPALKLSWADISSDDDPPFAPESIGAIRMEPANAFALGHPAKCVQHRVFDSFD